MFEYAWGEEPRGLTEIPKTEDLLIIRFVQPRWNLRVAIERGEHKLVDRKPDEPYRYKQNETLREVWQGALKAATRVEKKYGKKTSARGTISSGDDQLASCPLSDGSSATSGTCSAHNAAV